MDCQITILSQVTRGVNKYQPQPPPFLEDRKRSTLNYRFLLGNTLRNKNSILQCCVGRSPVYGKTASTPHILEDHLSTTPIFPGSKFLISLSQLLPSLWKESSEPDSDKAGPKDFVPMDLPLFPEVRLVADPKFDELDIDVVDHRTFTVTHSSPV